MQCFNLTLSQLQSFVGAGWTVSAGPFAAQANCLTACGGSSGGGSGGSGNFQGACGGAGVTPSVTATASGRTGAFASWPATLAMTCGRLGVGVYSFGATTPVTVSGASLYPQISGLDPGGAITTHAYFLLPTPGGGAAAAAANAGWTMFPFTGVFLYDDLAGNAITLTVS